MQVSANHRERRRCCWFHRAVVRFAIFATVSNFSPFCSSVFYFCIMLPMISFYFDSICQRWHSRLRRGSENYGREKKRTIRSTIVNIISFLQFSFCHSSWIHFFIRAFRTQEDQPLAGCLSESKQNESLYFHFLAYESFPLIIIIFSAHNETFRVRTSTYSCLQRETLRIRGWIYRYMLYELVWEFCFPWSLHICIYPSHYSMNGIRSFDWCYCCLSCWAFYIHTAWVPWQSCWMIRPSWIIICDII